MTQDGRRHLRRGVADEEDASVMRLGPGMWCTCIVGDMY